MLCSKDKTYDLKVADTSNMLLFIPGCKTPDQLKGEETPSNIVHTEVPLCPVPESESSVCVPSLPLAKNFGYKVCVVAGVLKLSLLEFEIPQYSLS